MSVARCTLSVASYSKSLIDVSSRSSIEIITMDLESDSKKCSSTPFSIDDILTKNKSKSEMEWKSCQQSHRKLSTIVCAAGCKNKAKKSCDDWYHGETSCEEYDNHHKSYSVKESDEALDMSRKNELDTDSGTCFIILINSSLFLITRYLIKIVK